MNPRVTDLLLERIIPNLRCIYAEEIIEELSCDMRSKGQREPIRVSLIGAEFRILDGEKRWRACKRLGMVRLRAIIMEADVDHT